MRRIAAILTISLAASCSWALMETVPKGYKPETGEPRCTGTKGFAAWDGLQAAAALVGGILAYKALDKADELVVMPGQDNSENTATLALVGGIGVALLHVLSANSGSGYANACLAARTSRDAALKREAELREMERADRPVPVVVPVDAGVDAPVDSAVEDAGL